MIDPVHVDDTDVAILEALQADGRLSVSELGRRIGLSQPATSDRLKRLEQKGVIVGYRAIIDTSWNFEVNLFGRGLRAFAMANGTNFFRHLAPTVTLWTDRCLLDIAENGS